MAAVMIELELLEPSGLGHDLLSEWATFSRDDGDGRASWSVKPRVDHAYHGDPPDRWYVVNRIVSRLLIRESVFRSVVKRYYLAELRPWEIAEITGRSERDVLTILLHVAGLVEREYRDLTGT